MARLSTASHTKQATMATASLVNGYWFYFNDNDTEIAVHGSAWSGRETVYVNDNPVSDKRELFKCSSNHEFTHNGFNYRVNYHLTNVLTGSLECSLYRDNKLLASQTKGFLGKSKGSWLFVVGMFLAGVGFGAATAALFKYFTA
jgi:hypothetical protein